MRFSSLAILGLVFVSIPSLAQVRSEKIVYGNYTCPQIVPCDGGSFSIPPSQWADYANACIKKGFGYSAPNGFVDSFAGLDSNLCLAPIPKSIPRLSGSQLAAICCITRRPDNSCSLRCSLIPE